jgi:hypothetical protein
MNLLKEYCEAQKNDQTSGGTEMNLNEFIKLSWGEKAQKVAEAVDAEYGREYYNYVVDCYDDKVIMRFYSYFDGSSKLMSIGYSISEEGVVTLGEIEEVHVSYEKMPTPAPTTATEEQGVASQTEETVATVAEPDATSTETTTEATVTNVEPTTVEETTTAVEETTLATTTVSEPINSDDTTLDNTTVNSSTETITAATSSTTADDAAQPINAQDTQMKVGADDEQTQEENSSSAPLNHSERAEFEALKRAKKEEILNSYKEYLSEEEYNGFFATIDEKTEEVLELELLKLYKTRVEETPRAKQRRVFALSSINNKNATTKDSLAQDIKYYLNRD